jgi:hypothetical protein
LLICLPFLVAGAKQPADGVMVERPQRSEDERPWGRRGAGRRMGEEGDGIAGSGLLWPGVEGDAAPSPATAGPGSPELGCRSSLRRARRHGAVRPQPGGLNQAGDHAARRGS